MDKFISYIGHHGPYILFIVSLFLTLSQKALFLYILMGYFVNNSINHSFKQYFHEQRPSPLYTHITLFGEEQKMPVQELENRKYGMPSGHSQQVWFFVTFMYLALKNMWVNILFFLIACITSVQRVVYKNHSTKQVIMGAIFGIVVAYFYHHVFVEFN